MKLQTKGEVKAMKGAIISAILVFVIGFLSCFLPPVYVFLTIASVMTGCIVYAINRDKK